jgi:5-oxoprolinase (ATP-hydrolysing) subunit C
LRVLQIPATATMQDEGRWGWRRFGVPNGGAFDRESLQLANALLGNDPFAPAVELALAGGVFEAEADLCLALVGAPADVIVNGRERPANALIALARGDVLQVGALRAGTRAYLAGQGGWKTRPVLGSASDTPVPRQLVPQSATGAFNSARLDGPPSSLDCHVVRCLPGPQAHLFDLSQLDCERAVGLHSNRVGLRLEGPLLDPAPEMPSEPSCFGAVQVTPSGDLLIVGPDGPTIGGYPKVAVVCQADLDRLGQLAPGSHVSLRLVDANEARKAEAAERLRLQERLQRIRLATQA